MPSKPRQFVPPGRESPTRQDHDRQRGSARARGYTTSWDKASAAFRRKHPLCIGCQAIGRVEATTVTDHVIPHRGDRALLWDRNNWQPSCGWHHSVIKQQLETLLARGEIKAEALRLDSPFAIAMTMAQMPTHGRPL